jgi:alkylation response protein AidB-like acyl-CoA dehydrogenase
MDLTFTPEEEAFRAEVRAFLAAELQPGWLGSNFLAMGEAEFRFGLQFERKMAARGWLTLSWPREYGGQERSHIEQLIFEEEMGRALAPMGGASNHGPRFVGPAIMLYGTPEQKARFLPPISRGEVIWSQCFTEPNAGSDMAAVEATARADGDDFVINGHKIYNGNTQNADFVVLSARTDPTLPKHRGLSLFAIPTDAPGLTVRPLWTLPPGGRLNAVYLDDVRVPRRDLLGEKDRGWYQMLAVMNYERSNMRLVAQLQRWTEILVAYARETEIDGVPLAADPVTQHRLAQLVIDGEAARVLAYRIGWLQACGQSPSYEASMSKYFTCELAQRIGQAGMALLGPPGQLERGSKYAPLQGWIEHWYLHWVAQTIVSGTSEVQRNIVAQRGLGLPR